MDHSQVNAIAVVCRFPDDDEDDMDDYRQGIVWTNFHIPNVHFFALWILASFPKR